MLPFEHPDRIDVAFDDHRLVANAGLILPVTLAHHLGLGELVDNNVDLGDAPGRANAGDKFLTLVASALAGGDCIDDADALRAGGTEQVLGCVIKAPSTLGTFLRSFRWGHVRQLDRVSRELLARAWTAGAVTGDVLMARLRQGRANMARGAAHFLRETVGGCAMPVPPDHSPCEPTAASTPTSSWPSAARWMCASPSLSASTPVCAISRGHTRGRVDAHSLLDGGRRRRGRD